MTSMCSRIRSVSLAAASAADEHGHDLAVVVDELGEQLADRVGRRAAWSRRCRRATSAIQSPLRIAPTSTTVSRTACVTSPVRTRSRADDIVASFSASSAFGSYSTSAASASGTLVVATTATLLVGERVDLAGDRDDVLVVREHDHAVGRARLDRLEDLRGRRVHRLTAGDHALHAEAREQAPDAVADTDRDDRGGDRRGSTAAPVRSATHLGLAHPAFLFDLLHEVGDADRVRAAGVDAGLDRGADVVRVHVAVPDAVAADDDDRVADRGPRLAERRASSRRGASRRYMTS